MDARTPKYSRPDNSTIDLEIDHPVYGWIPFTASPDDVEAHGRELFARAEAGDFGDVAAYEPPPPPTVDELAAQARARRNQLLAESDWTQLPDARAALGAEKAAAWDAYRQALRDVPEQPDFPSTIEWPVAPA